MAFFPCVRFEANILINFRGQGGTMTGWTYPQKMKYCIKLQNELSQMYELVNMLFIICLDRGIKMILENPYSEEHYLRRYWCLPPTLIDYDRRRRGDYYAKPTQYWFVNCSPKNNLIIDHINDNSLKFKNPIRSVTTGRFKKETGIHTSRTKAKSLFHPDYANRFIREFILDGDESQIMNVDIDGQLRMKEV